MDETQEQGPSLTARQPTHEIWISRAELMRLPTSGLAWDLLTAADAELGAANISNQDSNHDVFTMAVALDYARGGDEHYRAKAADAITDAIGTEDGDARSSSAGISSRT